MNRVLEHRFSRRAWLAAMAATFVHQQVLIHDRSRERCFQAFLNNHWSGLVLFAGLALTLWPQG